MSSIAFNVGSRELTLLILDFAVFQSKMNLSKSCCVPNNDIQLVDSKLMRENGIWVCSVCNSNLGSLTAGRLHVRRFHKQEPCVDQDQDISSSEGDSFDYEEPFSIPVNDDMVDLRVPNERPRH